MTNHTVFRQLIVSLFFVIFSVSSFAARETIFSDNFESGDTTVWNSTVFGGVISLSVNNAAAINGAFGMNVTIGSPGAFSQVFVQSDSPLTETNYHASFLIDTNILSVPNGDVLGILRGLDVSDNRVFDVALTSSSGQLNLIAHVLDDADAVNTTSPVVLGSGSHTVEVKWEAATSDGGNDGRFRLLLDGSLVATVSNLNNDLDTIDDVRLGAFPDSLSSAAGGDYYLDLFDSWREVPDEVIPSLSEWGMILMLLLIVGSAFFTLRRNSNPVSHI